MRLWLHGVRYWYPQKATVSLFKMDTRKLWSCVKNKAEPMGRLVTMERCSSHSLI